jgi:hypothetical protein
MPASSRSLQRQPSVPSHAPPSQYPYCDQPIPGERADKIQHRIEARERDQAEKLSAEIRLARQNAEGEVAVRCSSARSPPKTIARSYGPFVLQRWVRRATNPGSPNPCRCLESLLVLDASSALASTADSDPPQVGTVCNASFRPARYPEHQDQWEPSPGLTLPRNSQYT